MVVAKTTIISEATNLNSQSDGFDFRGNGAQRGLHRRRRHGNHGEEEKREDGEKRIHFPVFARFVRGAVAGRGRAERVGGLVRRGFFRDAAAFFEEDFPSRIWMKEGRRVEGEWKGERGKAEGTSSLIISRFFLFFFYFSAFIFSL